MSALPEGFIPHDGGPCPVGKREWVRVLFADGVEDQEYADWWEGPLDNYWTGECHPDERIIAYKVED